MYAFSASLCLLLFLRAAPAAAADQCDPDDVDCLLKHDTRSIRLLRVRPEANASLVCGSGASTSMQTTTKLEWWTARRKKQLAVWTPSNISALEEPRFHVDANGTLLVQNVNQALVEEYECVQYEGDKAQSHFILLRLDYSYFYDGPILSTVFWGSCISSLIFCVASFFLNILWIIIRKVSLWWIIRSERLSRVRTMVEAMEKYRQRQTNNLTENYHKRITTLRENYHQQVDELRNSYAKQTGKFRDYRQARLDNIRDNYNQQLTRLRDYGSQHADRLVEGYERQLNKMRTFTLQHRLKLMRQYKVKQQHINRLLDNIAAANNEQTMQQNEQRLREILDFSEPNTAHAEIGRSTSYYSLPDLSKTDLNRTI